MQTLKTGGYRQLALGVALVSAAHAANATGIGLQATNDLFLSVYDQTTKESIVQDLFIVEDTFIGKDNTNQTFNLSSIFTAWANAAYAKGDILQYNIASVNQVSPKSSIYDGVLTSHEYPDVFITPTNALNETNGILNNIQGNFLNKIGAISGSIDYGVNMVVPDGDQAGWNNSWGANETLSVDQSTTVQGVNQLTMQWLHTSGIAAPKANTKLLYDTLPGTFSLNVGKGVDTLVWTTSSVAAVPLPGTVWMFTGGLLSMLGLRKRKAMPGI